MSRSGPPPHLPSQQLCLRPLNPQDPHPRGIADVSPGSPRPLLISFGRGREAEHPGARSSTYPGTRSTGPRIVRFREGVQTALRVQLAPLAIAQTLLVRFRTLRFLIADCVNSSVWRRVQPCKNAGALVRSSLQPALSRRPDCARAYGSIDQIDVSRIRPWRSGNDTCRCMWM
jgi:hypothetical protein